MSLGSKSPSLGTSIGPLAASPSILFQPVPLRSSELSRQVRSGTGFENSIIAQNKRASPDPWKVYSSYADLTAFFEFSNRMPLVVLVVLSRHATWLASLQRSYSRAKQKGQSKVLLIHVQHGLSNRIRGYLSAKAFANATGGQSQICFDHTTSAILLFPWRHKRSFQ